MNDVSFDVSNDGKWIHVGGDEWFPLSRISLLSVSTCKNKGKWTLVIDLMSDNGSNLGQNIIPQYSGIAETARALSAIKKVLPCAPQVKIFRFVLDVKFHMDEFLFRRNR
jgi:hypothetical protein